MQHCSADDSREAAARNLLKAELDVSGAFFNAIFFKAEGLTAVRAGFYYYHTYVASVTESPTTAIRTTSAVILLWLITMALVDKLEEAGVLDWPEAAIFSVHIAVATTFMIFAHQIVFTCVEATVMAQFGLDYLLQGLKLGLATLGSKIIHPFGVAQSALENREREQQC